MHPRTPRALAAAAVLALALGACDDVPTTAPVRIAQPDQPARILSASGATLIPNTIKYRDNGAKPATGRSGNAVLQAWALLGKDGRTELQYSAVSADGWQTEPGTITRVQVKALDADSTVMFTYNENNLDVQVQRTQFSGVARGQYLRVQANVTGIDPHRTDVVTVTGRVNLRPDLAVQMQMAPEVLAERNIPITATISELNGDVGAYARCTLLVDGAAVDRSNAIWVDAGDAVTCLFSHAFSPGTHDVQVEARSLFPVDWDDSNNRSPLVRVEAAAGPTRFNHFANASVTSHRSRSSSTNSWTSPAGGVAGEYADEWFNESSMESAQMSGWIDRGVSGPVLVEVSQASGGRTLHADSWTEEMNGDFYCGARYGQGILFHLCSYNSGPWAWTNFSYSRSAGTVTYHSSSYSRTWDHITGEDIYYYHYNYESSYTIAPLAGVRDDYSFRVRLTAGDVVLTAESDFALTFQENASASSWCYDYQSSWDDYTSRTCLSADYKSSEWYGGDAYQAGW